MVYGFDAWVSPSHGAVPPPPGKEHHACAPAGGAAVIDYSAYPYFHNVLIRASVHGVPEKLPWGGSVVVTAPGELLIMY